MKKEVFAIAILAAVCGALISPVIAVACGSAVLLTDALGKRKLTEEETWFTVSGCAIALLMLCGNFTLLSGAVILSVAMALTLDSEKAARVAWCANYATLALLAFCTLMGEVGSAMAASGEGLNKMFNNFDALAQQAGKVAPNICYIFGLGVGGAGLHEMVKSQRGQGDGDLGSGAKKFLVGGGIAGAGGAIQMAAKSVTDTDVSSRNSFGG